MGSLQNKNTWIRGALLLLLAGVLTLIQTNFVGDLTIYSLKAAPGREVNHEQIIHNKAPEGGWSAQGENGVNVRIAIPYLVEYLHKTTNARILPLYKAVDLAFIWLGLILLFFYLRRWFLPAESLFACVYFAAILPLTFAYASYEPWDRASFVAWLLAYWAARAERFWTFFMVAILAVFIKYDVIVLPALYFLANVTRQNWRKIFVQSCAVGAALLAIFVTLRVLLPGGFEPRDVPATILRNLGMFAKNPFTYAPSLAFALPLLLAIVGYKSADRFMRASLWFAGLVTIPLLISTHFEEMRAEQMLFPLLAPAAVLGLRKFTSESWTAGTPIAARRQDHAS